LFLHPLDEERGWWRYHQLFADLLRARLAQERPERVEELHRAAAAWHEARAWPTRPSAMRWPPVTPSGRPG
jgi:LuxR family transcriptional regulator, maltose regulon positive regulatory protein